MGGNLRIKPFKVFLAEGGNVQVDGIQASHLNLSKIERKKIVDIIIKSLLKMNSVFNKEFGVHLWSDESLVKSGKVFSGSSEHFINLEISNEDFTKHKPSVGDIDVQVPRELEAHLSNFLVPGTKFGKITYLGRSTTAMDQISALFSVDFDGVEPLQVDFEFVDWGKLGPTEWARFSHSSSWDDIQEGIKGVFHKYLLGSIDFAWKQDILLLKGKKQVPTRVTIHRHAFSVGRGIRAKYAPAKDEEGNQIYIDGEVAFVEVKPKDSKYVNDLAAIFELLFRAQPKAKDLEQMNSFVGIIDLMKRYFKKSEIEEIAMEFIQRCWGKSAQKLYRGDPMMDDKMKAAAMNYMVKRLKLKNLQTHIDEKIETYYQNY